METHSQAPRPIPAQRLAQDGTGRAHRASWVPLRAPPRALGLFMGLFHRFADVSEVEHRRGAVKHSRYHARIAGERPRAPLGGAKAEYGFSVLAGDLGWSFQQAAVGG